MVVMEELELLRFAENASPVLVNPSPPESYDFQFFVTIIGDPGVGKSSLCERFLRDTFVENSQRNVDIGYLKGMVTTKAGKKAKLILCDSCTQLTTGMNFHRNSDGFVYVYDVTKANSLIHLDGIWMPLVQQYGRLERLEILVGNKCDLNGQRVILNPSGQRFAIAQQGMKFFECSAKTGENVHAALMGLVEDLVANDDRLVALANRRIVRNIATKTAPKCCGCFAGSVQRVQKQY